jgi:hypothetical protein
VSDDGITFTMRMWPDEIRRFDVTDDELSKLEAIARAATAGQWQWDPDDRSFGSLQDERSHYVTVAFARLDVNAENIIIDVDDTDAAHVAAFSPDVALRLIARLREYERRHPDSACCVNIGRRGGYWNCTCEPGVDDADP